MGVMGLTYPTVNTAVFPATPNGTPGPTFATQINADLAIIETHNHSPGGANGNLVPTSGLNINADLPMNGFNLLNALGGTFSGNVTAANYGAINGTTGNLTGALTVGGQISGVTDPTTAQQAATKHYVDGSAASGMLVANFGALVATTGAQYFPNGYIATTTATATQFLWAAPFACSFKLIRVLINGTASVGSNVTYSLTDVTTSTSVSVTLTPGAATGFNAGLVAAAAGDTLRFVLSVAGTLSTSPTNISVAVSYTNA